MLEADGIPGRRTVGAEKGLAVGKSVPASGLVPCADNGLHTVGQTRGAGTSQRVLFVRRARKCRLTSSLHDYVCVRARMCGALVVTQPRA